MRDKENEWIAIADLMAGAVGVVFLFFILAALNISKLHLQADADLDKLKGKLEKLQQPAPPSPSFLADKKRTEILRDITGVLNNQVGENSPIVSLENDLIRLPSDNMFDNLKTLPNERGKNLSKRIFDELSKIMPCYVNDQYAEIFCTNERPRRIGCIPVGLNNIAPCLRPEPFFETVMIEGHADSNRAEGECDNWCLSTERANAILKLGMDGYPSLFRLKNMRGELVFGLAGYGDSRPIAGIQTSDARQRRVNLRFIIEPSQR